MHTIAARNVHEALPLAVDRIMQVNPAPRANRNEAQLGRTLVHPGPVCTVYERPWERVLFWAERDANPFFHLLESIWMLAGRNDVKFPSSIVSDFAQYSDDGKTYHAAYGHRWRHHFGADQLLTLIGELRADPDTRRAVLQMWDAPSDLGGKGKDLPCNTHVYFQVNVEGALEMTVCCRSNDAVFGAYGANAVHFSVLQEFMADALGRPMGKMWQISNNWHFYEKTFTKVAPLQRMAPDGFRRTPCNPYEAERDVNYDGERVRNTPFAWGGFNAAQFLEDCGLLIDSHGESNGYRNAFISRVARPVLMASRAWRENTLVSIGWRAAAAKEILAQMPERNDWRVACEEWIERRVRRARGKA